MNVHQTSIDGVHVAELRSVADSRGAFTRLFCAGELQALMSCRSIVQINHSRTRARGAIRGMHYQQPPHAEMKFVKCLAGRVWDVAVDLRAGSPTFLRWHAEELTPENGRMMIIPEGCAHGFQALEAESELLYLHTAFYEPSAECGVRPGDERLGIAWPLPVSELSLRDQNHPPLSSGFTGIAS